MWLVRPNFQAMVGALSPAQITVVMISQFNSKLGLFRTSVKLNSIETNNSVHKREAACTQCLSFQKVWVQQSRVTTFEINAHAQFQREIEDP
ncbi:uncharacterized protein AtWU_04848 [Aspergillus tubingensis]|uniref:uncharacterized protein n=1 Tax=Aspergillus tubingensis TaxID=5068 RepID=UPI0015784A53|nr:uncharacterized protein AtWU_04848 [Aspergillus tubingensis]GFN15048.1 hypothetical protein AtWU_04848 [Aspergillus tubingensis]